jgi:hypothetical protein
LPAPTAQREALPEQAELNHLDVDTRNDIDALVEELGEKHADLPVSSS